MIVPDVTSLPIGSHRLRCDHCGKGPSDKTLGVTLDQEGVVFHCFRCGFAGAQRPDRDVVRPVPTRTTSVPEKLEWSTKAEGILRKSSPIRGTPVQTYLEHRGCALPPRDGHLRYLPPNDKYPPTMLAIVTDARTGKPLTLHFTRLARDGRGKAGTGADKTLLKDHRKAGGVIRLWPDEAVTVGIAIAEGIETALAAAHAYSPIWAAIDAGNLEAFPLLNGIECLMIIADHDDAGLRAAARCAQRWADAGREASVAAPETAGADMADVAVAG